MILLFLLSFFTPTLPVTDDLTLRISRIVDQELGELVAFYKELHQDPEVSLNEEKTSARLAIEMRKLGFEVTERVGGYGIVAILKNGQGPQLLYRTDMDALPMLEKTGLPYASTKQIEYEGGNVGVMHSCGHDMHMTTWLGTAKAMVQMRDEWSGTLMMIGQPAEEIGAGAGMMLNAGLYERFGVPDLGFGIHCSPVISAGKIGVSAGFSMANTESVDITVFGVGAHGASPHMSIDPIVVASMMIMEIQTIVSRNIKPIDDAVITVGAITGGTKHNIIPDVVHLKLTVRTYRQEVRELIHRRLKEIAKGTAIAAGLPEDKWPIVQPSESYTPANFNHLALTQSVRKSAATALGKENVVEAEPQMVGEDFSRYGQTEHKVPTVLYWLGTVPPSVTITNNLPGLHSPYYFPDPEKSLSTGVTSTTKILIDHFKSGI